MPDSRGKAGLIRAVLGMDLAAESIAG